MNAFIFTGQGCQKQGMGAELYEHNHKARELFEYANNILGENYTDIIFNGSEDLLMDTRNTQLAVFIYEVVVALSQNTVKADYVAGHSLGEYSALVVNQCLSFEEGINLVKKRGQILYEAYNENPGAMGAVIGLPYELVQNTLRSLSDELGEGIYIANYNGPGQLVIAGCRSAIKEACKRLKDLGAKRALLLPMKASGHNPSVYKEANILSEYINKCIFNTPICPIFQCADGLPHTDINEIRENLIKHLTHPVRWMTITQNLVKAGVEAFYEIGTDDTLQKIVTRMYPDKLVTTIWSIPDYLNINPYKINEDEFK